MNGYRTAPGEVLAVIGDCPELGDWDLSRAVKLEYIKLAESLLDGTDPLAPDSLKDREIFDLLGFD